MIIYGKQGLDQVKVLNYFELVEHVTGTRTGHINKYLYCIVARS
jgi:hypothetical protein